MMRRYLISIPLVVITLFTIVPASIGDAKTKTPDGFKQTLSYTDVVKNYASATAQKPFRVLIVPGHEPSFGGAVYQGVYEREIVVEIGAQLANYLGQNPKVEVILARTNTSWNQDLADYFNHDWSKIEKFVATQKKAMEKLVSRGRVTTRAEEEQVDHAAAPSDVALRLYGIGKWANENDVDLVVHLHINDSPDHGPNDPSAYSGFAVYVPDHQYGNAAASLPLGTAIANRLATMNATSTLPIENRGVIEDQELIALGANGTVFVPSTLIEYAYITEPKFTHPEVRQTVTKDFAYETYLGIQDYVKDSVVTKYPTASLPYTFTSSSITPVGSSSPATYALQAALHIIDLYPVATTTIVNGVPMITPTMRTLSTCPVSGIFGPCTIDSITAFQKNRGLPQTGSLDVATRNALNLLFSTTPVLEPVPTAPIIPITPIVSSTIVSPVSVPAIKSTVSSSCKLPTANLSLNTTDAATNGDVSRLQTLLATNNAIYPEGKITGFFGPATKAAVQKFQLRTKIVSSTSTNYGTVGPATRAALKMLCT